MKGGIGRILNRLPKESHGLLAFWREKHLASLCFALIFAAWGLKANAQIWTQTSAPSTNWQAVACSADGTRLIAVSSTPGAPSSPGLVYTSSDSSATWKAAEAPATNWLAVACSADGTKLLAAAGPYEAGPVYVSTNAGGTWEPATLPQRQWTTLACSADGHVFVAGGALVAGTAYGSYVFVSTNTGGAWLETDLELYLNSLACSADAAKMVAVFNAVNGGWILKSTNTGDTWFQVDAPYRPWARVASSADGRTLVAAAGRISVSTNAGSTWAEVTNAGVSGTAVAVSATGERIIVADSGYYGGPIFASQDAGATWTQADAPVTHWVSVASSSDGARLFAAVNGGGIYTWQTTPTPVLNVERSPNGIPVSWLVPSMPFALQASSDLLAGNWVEITDPKPTLNYTNLHYEVALPTAPGNRFYRLVSK